MTDAPIPDDEADRLQALLALRVLDTPAEERFDRITRTARDLLKVPIALISLIDAERQWFKSRQGLDAAETPRAVSFCGHAIVAGDEAFVIENALADARFADNPLVVGAPDIRFYAGMPLHALNGRRLGTLCVIDRVPRRFDADDARRLRDLAAWAEQELNHFVGIEAAVAEMRDTFVRLVSHELRTPVTSVVGALDLLGHDGGDGSGALLDIAREGASRLNRIVDDIVDMAELDAGHADLPLANVDLALFVEVAVERYAAQAAQAGVSIAIEVAANLAVRAALKPLGRILRVLLDNALRFSPADAQVTVAAGYTQPGLVRIAVRDQGPGIAEDFIPRLFQPFAQGDASDIRQHEGVGVNLAICYRLAAAMGGRLGYEVVPDGGACVFIDLPEAASG